MNTHIIYRKELFLKGITYILICLILGLMATYLLKSRSISIVILVIMVLPVFFIKLLLKLFTKKIYIQLYPDSFTIRVLNNRGKEFERKIELKETLSYNIGFPTDNISEIKFKLRNGSSFSYSISQKKQTAEDVDSEELVNSFHLLIRNYNQQTSKENKIIFLPSFYASNTGLVVITLLSSLFILTIALVSYLKGFSSLPFTFVFTFLLISQLILKRKKDLDYYKKMQTQ